MPEVFDAIVLGTGGFGSSAVYHLARRGLRVLGIDRFGPAHDRGSSHGETRIIRKAYFEHTDYVPLLLHAYELWSELEAEAEQQLFWQCGLMIAGLPDSEAVSGARLSARQHNLHVENLPAAAALQRWPAFRVPESFDVVFEPDAGFLKVEDCVRTYLDRAVTHGATLLFNEPVESWTSNGREVRVRTATREVVAAALVITAGAWAAAVMSQLRLPLTVLRKPIFWHPATNHACQISSGMPTFYFEMPQNLGESARSFYGFPAIDGQTLKVAEHSGGDIVSDPLLVDRVIHDRDSEPVSQFVSQCLPLTASRSQRQAICMYTITPDRHFVVDNHPEFPNVSIGCGFSGHGFKFTSVLGAALADLATNQSTNLPVQFLGLDRFHE